MLQDSEHPIGIFDSGMGGLTIARTIAERMPNEGIVYFGDTAHTPWGDKSTAAIQAYSVKICDLLLKHHCKLIVIACHTASTAAYELVKEYVGDKAHVINVVEPIVNYIQKNYKDTKIGLIGTKQTVRSNSYQKHLDLLNQNLELSALATPLLVPLIEEGFLEKKAAQLILHEYLSHTNLTDIKALILGCTHYPLLKKSIQAFYQDRVDIIDASSVTADLAQHYLSTQKLLNQKQSTKRLFYASDYNDFFVAAAKNFFPEHINLEPYPLWD